MSGLSPVLTNNLAAFGDRGQQATLRRTLAPGDSGIRLEPGDAHMVADEHGMLRLA